MAHGSEQEAHGPSSSSLVATTGQPHANMECAGNSGASQVRADELQEEAGASSKADASARASPDASTALAGLRALASSRRLHLHPTFAYQVLLSLSLLTSAPASFSRPCLASFAPTLCAVPRERDGISSSAEGPCAKQHAASLSFCEASGGGSDSLAALRAGVWA